ncbi:LPS assembly lipoprotein LptE [Thalassotalea ponticola]|uniref:LPS-assembly lipoprotein LptE n=1 Tax=Thalassotalea ponticola TaxID=1523392 RepID=UPI0025B39F6F|nr:LPS assembly lipoprotein LptE [Thalassotalea ponticola]MDN3652564.1 LPS assembly lipoprotein LptE [Thalassotalea ponticola]
MSIKKRVTSYVSLTVSALLTVALLSGCGFKLRGDYLLPEQLQTLYVSSSDPNGELARIVRQHLSINEVDVVKAPAQNTPQLRLLTDKLDRRTLSLFNNGQVAEYELTYSVAYELIDVELDKRQRFNFAITRNYQDDPDRALAKSRELNLLHKEMRFEAADIILRNLASSNF